MKHLVTLAALTAGLLASGAAEAEETVKLSVSNMHCASCPLIVQKSLSTVPGVIKVAVSYEQKLAVVTFDEQKTNVQAFIDAATKAGYPTKIAAAAATPRTQ